MIKIKCENAHACVRTTLWKHQDIMINAKVKMWISFFSENSPIYMLCHACARVPIESCYHTLCLWSQQDLFMCCWLNRHHKCLQSCICTQEESAFSPIVIGALRGVCSHDTQEKFWMYRECFWGHCWARNITSAFLCTYTTWITLEWFYFTLWEKEANKTLSTFNLNAMILETENCCACSRPLDYVFHWLTSQYAWQRY